MFGWNDPETSRAIQAAFEEYHRNARDRRPLDQALPPSRLERELGILERYLSRADYAHIWLRSPAAARLRWWWNFRQFLRLCVDLGRAQRRISRGRSWQQCGSSLGELVSIEVTVYGGIAEMAARGLLHFLAIRYDRGAIAARYAAVFRLVHPAAPVTEISGGG